MAVINPQVEARVPEFAAAFQAAQPFRHVEIPDFLDAALCARLLADFPDFEARHALNEMGEVGAKAVRMDVRDISASYRDVDLALQSPAFLDLVSRITGIPDLLYDPDYIGGGTHDNRDGQGLDAHVDFNYHPRTRWHRRLNLIVYLNHDWDDAWGGALELHSDPWNEAVDRVTRVSPTFNRCAIFETTESSWHGFSQIRLPADAPLASRKSFAIYLYTRERPRSETAPPHATIYVPETMPAGWQGGRVLSVGDVRELQSRFTRMRSQLRHLYEREKHFGAQIASLENALDETRAGLRLPLQGYATQPRGSSGLWPDGWAGSELSACFVPTRPTRELRLVLWSPPQLGTDQQLAIELDGVGYTQVLRPGMRTPVTLTLAAPLGHECILRVHAAATWMPSADAGSGDERALAYRIIEVALVH